jgi:hypothetical protein
MQQIKKKPKLFYILIIYNLIVIGVSFFENKILTGCMVKIGLVLFVVLWIQMFFYVRHSNKVASRFYGIKWRNIFTRKKSD